MKKQSRYDQLLDKYEKITYKKYGSKYEILTAFVFKSLCDAGIVVHDIKLVGETDLPPAQIDVCIEVGGIHRRILIECKDFDVSGEPVGIDIIRRFWAVVMDLKPDASFVVTCNRFTDGAMRYAKAKGIKLAILRDFREEDRTDRIERVYLHIIYRNWMNCRPALNFKDKESFDKWNEDLKKAHIDELDILSSDSIYVNTPLGRFKLVEFLEHELNAYPKDNLEYVHVKHAVDTNDCSIEIESLGGIPIGELILEFDITYFDNFWELTSHKIAELLLESLDEDDDIVIFKSDLERYEYNLDTHEIKLKVRDDDSRHI